MIESVFSSLGILFFERLIINCITLFFLVRVCFINKSAMGASSSTYYMFGLGVFLVTYSLKSIDISIGFAFGLFAIFSMLRYRTEVIPFKEMTYLFLVTVASLLCAVSPLSAIELLVVLSILSGSAYVAEAMEANSKVGEQLVRYEIIENVKPENYHILIQDLKRRTGLDVIDVAITSIDFIQDAASLRVFYTPHEKKGAATESAYTISETPGKVS